MPHRLNSFARHNPEALYNILMRSAWSSLKECAADPGNMGGLPGAVMVLHTFGSDLKYHVHAHCLVTFGGINTNDPVASTRTSEWCWPKRKKKIVPFRQMRRVFRTHFLSHLKKEYPNLKTRELYEELREGLLKKQWCVHAERPTTDTKVIEGYLGRYICRIGLSKKKIHYDQVHQHITLTYNDYRRQKTGQAAPKSQKRLHPLLAVHHILQHVLPPYFQKCRYYGLHASATYKKYQASIPTHLKRNQQSIRTLFQILKAMLGIEKVQCEMCKGTSFEKVITRLIIPGHQNKSSAINSEVLRLAHIHYLSIISIITCLNQNIKAVLLSFDRHKSRPRTGYLMSQKHKSNLFSTITQTHTANNREKALTDRLDSLYLVWNLKKPM